MNCAHNKICMSLSGMAALDSRASGKMGMRAVVYYTTTTVIAVFIGIVMVLIIHPGKGSKDEFTNQQKIEQISPADAFLDLIRYLYTLLQQNKHTHSKFPIISPFKTTHRWRC